MNRPIFITGIGTEIGKTVVSAIVTEALQADYWKPVQAGFETGTDALRVQQLLTNTKTIIHPEIYCLQMPASPHIAARAEQIFIDIDRIGEKAKQLLSEKPDRTLVIEGAGGLLVPLNEQESIADLILSLHARVILVSRNYLGSINHSRLTAAYCKQMGIDVIGWIFNDQYLDYEDEIVAWSGFPSLGSVPYLSEINPMLIHHQAENIRPQLYRYL
ncbi:MAG: dethiobiotin synthase [Chitinophagaceae bacterium]|nr:dethiobiotin synthase [Chitinophagaceae bacterium]